MLKLLIFILFVSCSSKIPRNHNGSTPLMIAAGLGKSDEVKTLLSQGADVHVIDSQMGVRALHRAAQSGNVDSIKYLLEAGAFIDDLSSVNGHTPLLDAAFCKRYDGIEFLLRSGANYELKNTLGLNLSDWAIRQKDIRIQKLLEEQKARDLKQKKSQTLIAAVQKNDLEEVKRLLSQGEDPEQTAKDGNTPLLIASKFGYTDIVSELLKFKANPNKVDKLMKATPGHKAAFFGHAKILELLISHGLILDAQGPYNGYTALHDAILNSHIEASKVLIKAGASITIEGVDGRTPKDLAIQLGISDQLFK